MPLTQLLGQVCTAMYPWWTVIISVYIFYPWPMSSYSRMLLTVVSLSSVPVSHASCLGQSFTAIMTLSPTTSCPFSCQPLSTCAAITLGEDDTLPSRVCLILPAVFYSPTHSTHLNFYNSPLGRIPCIASCCMAVNVTSEVNVAFPPQFFLDLVGFLLTHKYFGNLLILASLIRI